MKENKFSHYCDNGECGYLSSIDNFTASSYTIYKDLK